MASATPLPTEMARPFDPSPKKETAIMADARKADAPAFLAVVFNTRREKRRRIIGREARNGMVTL